jgi:D-alanyl-D-alanine carboxypeptidase
MTHSGFMSDESKFDDFAVGYWMGEKGDLPLQPAPEIREGWAGGAGAIVSTIADMAAWDTALPSGKIVSPQDYALMTTPPHLPNGARTTYGMGLGVDPLDGHRRIWHNGGSLGSFTMNATYPDDHLDIIVFENSTSGEPGAIETAAFEAIVPGARIAANAAAPGEDLALRPKILHFLDEAMNGTLQANELDPEFAKVATPEGQKQIAAMFQPLGKPTAVIFKGKRETPDGAVYRYRVDFASTAMTLSIFLDKKTNRVGGLSVNP